MDENWQTIATNLGYNATINSQEFLDDINNLNNSDILIISSGLINLPENRQQNVRQFVEQGGNLYVQAEYLINLPGNQIFSNLINNLGGSFSWDGELDGSLAPMDVIGDLTDNFNNVTALTYFWYGTYGSGDASIHSILKYNNFDFGFIFCPPTPTFGKIITTSDQDWVRTLNSEELMANVLNYLVAHMPLSALPIVTIDVEEDGPCDNIAYTFDVNIENSMGGSDLQWMVNGINVIGATNPTFISSNLIDGDVVECILTLSTFCTSYTHTSNPILIAPIDPVSNTSIEIIASGDTFCENEMVTFNAITSGLENAISTDYQWVINNIPVIGANTENFSTSNLNDQDTVSCILTYDNNCFTNNTLSSAPIILNIIPTADPEATIEANQTTICEGEPMTFTVIGNDLGNNPTFQWQIDGINTGNNSPIFTTSILSEGQNITCTINTNQDCAITNTIITNTITANVLSVAPPSITISSNAIEICPGAAVTFNATGINFGANPSFQWQINGVNEGLNQPEFTTNQILNGQLVSCILTADNDCSQVSVVESAPISIIVTEGDNPVINIEANTNEICEGQEVVFTASGINFGNNPSFEWMIDGVAVSGTDSFFSTTNLSNNQIVTCQITNPDACEFNSTAISNDVSIKVNKIEIETLEILFETCGNADGIIEIEGIGGTEPYTYEWMNGANQNLLTGLSYGKFTVTVTDAIGCSSIGQIEMGQIEAPEVNNIIINKADCEGDNGTAEIIMFDSTMNYTFEWLNSNETTVSLSNHAENLQTGVYSVIISNEYGCTTSEYVIIDQISSIQVSVNEDVQLTLGESIQIETIVNSTGNVTYSWSQSEGANCSGCPNPVLSPLETSVYTVTVTNEFGCTATDDIKIYVEPKRDVYIPNAFTPNNDGVNDYFTVYGGENVKNIKSMSLFDRWGSEIFSKADFAPNIESEGWNGAQKGKRFQSGVYVYLIEVEYIDGETKLHKGDVSITPNK